MAINAVVFDAYGTLFDVQSVLRHVENAFPGWGLLVNQLWRLKQLEYTWLRTCMDAFEDFAAVTSDSLVYALRATGLDADTAVVENLAEAYLHLDPMPDAAAALAAVAGCSRAIFSNGSRPMLRALLRNAGMDGLLEHVVSVDDARAYKPSPKAHALVEREMGVAPGNTLFVSSNGFDVAGAKRFGFSVAWVRRGGGTGQVSAEMGPTGTSPMEMFRAQRLHAEILGGTPDHVLAGLTELPSLVAGLQAGAT